MRTRLIIVLSFLIQIILNFSCSYLPSDEDLNTTISYQETPDYIYLSSQDNPDGIGFMFLPGGLVDPHAYLTLMEKVAEDSINVIIPKYPANLAILDLSKYENILEEFNSIDSWYIGGHSLGGIAALSAVKTHPEQFAGLILLGSYPSESFEIADWDQHVLSIYAENDHLSTPEDIDNAKSFLPPAYWVSDLIEVDTLDINNPSTLYYCINGGNHSQFGDYGFQNGDGMASISTEEQHEEIFEMIRAFINWNENE